MKSPLVLAKLPGALLIGYLFLSTRDD